MNSQNKKELEEVPKMNNFEEKMKTATDDIINLTSETMNIFGEKFEDCFPVETYSIVTVGKKTYRLKVTVTIN